MVAPELRADLVATLGLLDQQLRGLWRGTAEPVSPGLKAALTEEIRHRQRLRDRVQRLVEVLDQADAQVLALADHGYPDAPRSALEPDLLAELRAALATTD